MDYFKNVDKSCDTSFTTGLYNSVLSITDTAPVIEPVTLAEAKLWCKIDDNTEDDGLVTALITAARIICEKFVNLSFYAREFVVGLNNSNGGFVLPYGPVAGTPTVTDVDSVAQDVIYNVGQLQSPRGVCIATYTGGYSTLPENLKTALKSQIIFLYENRGEGTKGISPIAEMILWPLRVTS